MHKPKMRVIWYGEEDGDANTATEVFEVNQLPTGVLDATGRMIVRPRREIGFDLRGSGRDV